MYRASCWARLLGKIRESLKNKKVAATLPRP
jgi:hypothetical protein